MTFSRDPRLALGIGLAAIGSLAYIGGTMTGPGFAAELSERSVNVIADAGGGSAIRAEFRSPNGWPSRHPVLVGGESFDDSTRASVARAVAAIPGVGGIRWSDGDALVDAGVPIVNPLHCQEDVQALLRARTIRFEEGSARIDTASLELVDEVAAALRPCLGSIVSVTGHTDESGAEERNVQLSQQRADAVRIALMRRGIPANGLRAKGLGSQSPVEGLDRADPANRRIEFVVIATEPLVPSPVDTPGPH